MVNIGCETSVDEVIDATNEQTASLNPQLNTRTELDMNATQPATPTTMYPVSEGTTGSGILNAEITGVEMGPTSMTQPAHNIGADRHTTQGESHVATLETNRYHATSSPNNEAIQNNNDLNMNASSPQKIPSTKNIPNETTPTKVPLSSRPPLSTPQNKEVSTNGSTPTAAAAATPTTASANTYRAILPKNSNAAASGTGSNNNNNSTVSTPGPPPHPPVHPSYGWIPGGSPQHPYHPHPYPMHHYHHPPMYGSPDSAWNKRTDLNGSKNSTTGNSTTNNGSNGDTNANTTGNQQLSPMPPPYGWTSHHMSSYPYAPPPPPPHPYANGVNARYPPMQSPHPHHHYAWPPPMTMQPPLLHPQQRHPMNTNRNNTAKGNSSSTTARGNNSVKSNNSIVASSPNNKTSTDTITSKLVSVSANNNDGILAKSTNKYVSENIAYNGYNHLTTVGINAIQNSRNDNRSLSPTEIELHHRDEIQHMGCTCKKTRCLKLYCQCFGAKLYCGVNCRCVSCFNNRKHERHRKEAMRNILSRNLSAFDTKFKKDSTIVVVENQQMPSNNIVHPTTSTTIATPVSNATPTIVPSAPTASCDVEQAPVVEAKQQLDTTATMTSEATVSINEARILAHRLGCKCRKSACMKKYCECYAANVKCSASCRCMGCKNLGGGNDYRDHNLHHGMGIMSAAAAQAAHQAAIQYHRLPPQRILSNQVPHNLATMRQYGMVDNNRNSNCLPPRQPHQQHQPPVSTQNNWNDPLSAAESLTFLKRGSPNKINGGSAATHQPNRPYAMGVSPITKSPGANGIMENVSIPSLASSSESDSPRDAELNNHVRVMSTPESFRGENSALLLAAVAMTEFGQSPPPTSSMLSPDTIRTYNTENGDDDGDDEERLPATPINTDNMQFTPQQPNASKRSINFDDIQDSDTISQKKSKTIHWMS